MDFQFITDTELSLPVMCLVLAILTVWVIGRFKSSAVVSKPVATGAGKMMLRRSITQGLAGCLSYQQSHCFSTTPVTRAEQDPMEIERERELRQQTLQKYKVKVPEMTQFEYGHFSTGGINAAAAQQAFASGGANSNSVSGGLKIDWLMLLTGCALAYYSAKIIYQQLNRGIDDLDFPLWTASVETQAKHLIFSIQFDPKTKEELKREFQMVRQANPFADFFDWVRSKRPEFTFGTRYDPETIVNTVVGILSRTDRRELVAFAQALQSSLWRTGGNPTQRLDDFMDKLIKTEGILSAAGMGGPTGQVRAPVLATPHREAKTEPTIDDMLTDLGPHASTPFGGVQNSSR